MANDINASGQYRMYGIDGETVYAIATELILSDVAICDDASRLGRGDLCDAWRTYALLLRELVTAHAAPPADSLQIGAPGRGGED